MKTAASRFRCALMFHYTKTRLHVAIRIPCYKTGSVGPRLAPLRANQAPNTSHPSGFTLQSPAKRYTRFPHGTCALSVSKAYVSLGGKHHLFAVHYQALLLVTITKSSPVSRLSLERRAFQHVTSFNLVFPQLRPSIHPL